jgi:hypothetical protein
MSDIDKAMLEKLSKGSGKKSKKPKHLKEFRAKEQHDGSYHVTRHSGKPDEQPMEHSAANMNEVQQALQEHMGQGEPGMGADEAAPALGVGQPGVGGSAPQEEV